MKIDEQEELVTPSWTKRTRRKEEVIARVLFFLETDVVCLKIDANTAEMKQGPENW